MILSQQGAGHHCRGGRLKFLLAALVMMGAGALLLTLMPSPRSSSALLLSGKENVEDDAMVFAARLSPKPNLFALSGIPFAVSVKFSAVSGSMPRSIAWKVVRKRDGFLAGNGTFGIFTKSSKVAELDFTCSVTATGTGRDSFSLLLNDTRFAPKSGLQFEKKLLHGWTSLAPPIVTLALSVASGEVFPSLLCGIWVGAFLVSGLNPIAGLLRTFDTYFAGSFTEDDHSGVLVFTFLLGGLIKLTQENGGTQGLAALVQSSMKTNQAGQFAIWLFCLLIFIDDYTCILIAGGALRSIVPVLGISVYKLGHIVHSMAVCMASMVPVSSWVGVELGYLAAQKSYISGESPFVLLVKCIPGRTFPLMLIFSLLVSICFRRDFPRMHAQEAAAMKAAAQDAELSSFQQMRREDDEDGGNAGARFRWLFAALPFSLMVVFTIVGMYVSGAENAASGASLIDIISCSDSVSSLIWASLGACIVSFSLTLALTPMTFKASLKAWLKGCEELLEPTLILLLAWALGDVIRDVNAAAYLSKALRNAHFLPGLLPAATSVMSYVISFACATSMGTQAILIPLIVPLASSLGGSSLVTQCVGAVFGGSVFGNVCSPIADTTVLTSMSTKCDLQTHVRTTMPTSLLVATLSTFLVDLPVGLDAFSTITGLVVCSLAIVFFHFFSGVRADRVESESAMSALWSRLAAKAGCAKGRMSDDGTLHLLGEEESSRSDC